MPETQLACEKDICVSNGENELLLVEKLLDLNKQKRTLYSLLSTSELILWMQDTNSLKQVLARLSRAGCRSV